MEGVRMTQGYMIHVFQTIYIDIPEKQNTQHNTKSMQGSNVQRNISCLTWVFEPTTSYVVQYIRVHVYTCKDSIHTVY